MSEQPDEKLETSVVAKGPGDVLQAARIEQGISIDDIARQMNLNAKILKSIEEDDYSDVQSPIFIRGYLRTYARLVGVDEDNTIKVFSEFYQKDDPEIKSIGNTAPEISSNDFRVKWMTYIVIIGLIALLSVWWVNNYKTFDLVVDVSKQDETIKSSNTMAENSVNDGLENSIPSIDPSVGDKVRTIELISVNTSDDQDQIIPIELNINSDVDAEEKIMTEEAITKDDLIESNNTLPEDTSEILEVTSVSTNQLESSEKIKSFTREVSALTGNDVLEINVIASSWGEIKDATNFKLLQDLMNAGNTYRLVGQKPFKIFLGNGYGVELALNGHSIDFSKHIKSSNNTARFELEQ